MRFSFCAAAIRSSLESLERIANNVFQLPDFLIDERSELPLAPPARKRSPILPDEHEEVRRTPIRRFDGIHDALNGQIVTTQTIGLNRQIFFDRALNATEKELGVRGGAEKTTKITCVVQDFDISSISRLPAYMGAKAEDMTAPDTVAKPNIILDRGAPSRDDSVSSGIAAITVGASHPEQCHGSIGREPVDLFRIGPGQTPQSTAPFSASLRWAAVGEKGVNLANSGQYRRKHRGRGRTVCPCFG